MKLTRKDAIRLHREMWKWIAIETLKQKRKVEKNEWFETFMPTVNILHECFCCEYAYTYASKTTTYRHGDKCLHCPIDWCDSKVSYYRCIDKLKSNDDKGIYAVWLNCDSWEEAAKLARQIAELPEIKEA